MSEEREVETGRCGDCRFIAGSGDAWGGMSACHRFPPVHAGQEHPRGGKRSVWPAVSVNDWCGEFQPRAPLTDGDKSRDDQSQALQSGAGE